MTDLEIPSNITPMLETRQIYKQYQSGTTTLEVLRGVDFLLEQGGFLAVVGQSGSGKSTLLHVMGLLDAPDRGEVWLDAGGKSIALRVAAPVIASERDAAKP